MSKLRESQLSTLREAWRLENGFTGAVEAADLSHIVGIHYVTTDMARDRLNRLAAKGYLTADRSTPHRVFYTLTEKGKGAIRG